MVLELCTAPSVRWTNVGIEPIRSIKACILTVLFHDGTWPMDKASDTVQWYCCQRHRPLPSVESKILSLIHILRFPYQNLCKVLINMPILLLVCLDQRRFWHGLRTRSVKVWRTRGKCSFCVSQSRPVRKPGKLITIKGHSK